MFVNDRQVQEVILQDGDSFELGAGGPKVRLRVRPEDRAATAEGLATLASERDRLKPPLDEAVAAGIGSREAARRTGTALRARGGPCIS